VPMDNSTPERPVALNDLLTEYGDRWQVSYDDATHHWTAVERPTPSAINVLVAANLNDLAEKLSGAG
jgi:hypothetical protein